MTTRALRAPALLAFWTMALASPPVLGAPTAVVPSAAIASASPAASTARLPPLPSATLAHPMAAPKPPVAPPKATAAPVRPTAQPPKPVVAARGPLVTPPPPSSPKLAKGWAPAAYVAMSSRWHAPAPGVRRDEHGRPLLVLAAINRPERTELPALSDRGGFAPLVADRAAHALRGADGLSHPVDARLLDLLLELELHFDVAEIRFLSGYRPHHAPPPRATDPAHAHLWRGSNHGCGRAVDLVVPGQTDEEVAKFARTRGFVGVGIYPTSGFVHVDVRTQSFFWFDRSGPGRPNRTVRFLGSEAAQNDRLAHELGLLPSPDPTIRSVDAAVEGRLKLARSLPPPPTTGEASEGNSEDDGDDEP